MPKVLVVDDSAFMRKSIVTILEKDPSITVVGTAANGEEALKLIPQLDPDVVTLDVEMPKMDGLTVLKHIMAEMPRPVLMVSSITSEGAETTLKAMDAGAMDFIAKPSSNVSLDIINIETELREKVKAVARRRPFMRARPLPGASGPAPGFARPATPGPGATPASGAGRPAAPALTRPSGPLTFSGGASRDLVAIGVSTGGPPAVQKVLSALPKEFPVPILIAQHMPAAFTGPFARRLDGICAISVKEAENGERLRPGTAYVAPGGKHIRLESRAGLLNVSVSEEPKEALYKPSANVLMESVGNALGRRALGVILTGMGSDGLEGIKVMKQKGGRALAQSEATCVVYGMPKAIVDAQLADEIIDIDDMAAAIMQNMQR